MANKLFQGAAHASAYLKYRPIPPSSLVDHILSYLDKGVSFPS